MKMPLAALEDSSKTKLSRMCVKTPSPAVAESWKLINELVRVALAAVELPRLAVGVRDQMSEWSDWVSDIDGRGCGFPTPRRVRGDGGSIRNRDVPLARGGERQNRIESLEGLDGVLFIRAETAALSGGLRR